MSIRLLALIVLGIIALPLVFLHRSSIAGPPDYCRLKAEVFRLIASERDRGVSKKKFKRWKAGQDQISLCIPLDRIRLSITTDRPSTV